MYVINNTHTDSNLTLSKDSSPKCSSRPWGFEFLRAYVCREACWICHGLTHNSAKFGCRV